MNKTIFTPGEDGKTMEIERSFEAPVSMVWKYWTKRELLEQWWAPKPWNAVTREFNFREGGRWLYDMTGPEGEKHCGLAEYIKIDPEKDFTAIDAFCDEDGNRNEHPPVTEWKIEFAGKDGNATIKERLKFASAEEMDKLTEMGFREGFSQALDQLEELLKTGK